MNSHVTNGIFLGALHDAPEPLKSQLISAMNAYEAFIHSTGPRPDWPVCPSWIDPATFADPAKVSAATVKSLMRQPLPGGMIPSDKRAANAIAQLFRPHFEPLLIRQMSQLAEITLNFS